MGWGWYQAIYVAPDESTMHEIQRIFYYHVPSAMVALVGLLRLTTNVSFGSPRRSQFTSTVIVPVVWPAGIVNVLEAAW